MVRRVASALLGTDKLMVGKADQSEHQYSNLDDVKEWLQTNELTIYGYRWKKGVGNSNVTTAGGAGLELRDKLEGVGTLKPGYIVEAYVKVVPFNEGDPDSCLQYTVLTPIE